MITEREFILRGSCFCEKYSLLLVLSGRSEKRSHKVEAYALAT